MSILDENSEPTPELKPAEKKLSSSERIQLKIKSKLDDGYQVQDKHAVDDLKKSVMDELELKKGWNTNVRNFIGKELTDRDISIHDKGFKAGDLGKINVNVDAPLISETLTAPAPSPAIIPKGVSPFGNMIASVSSPNNPHGTLPSSANTTAITEPQQQQQQPLTKEQLEAQARFFKKIGGFVAEIYIGLGLVESDDKEEQKELEKPKPLKEFRADVDALMLDLNELMIVYGMRMPKYLDLGLFAVSVGMVFGMPIIKKILGKTAEPKPKYDDSLDEIEVKV